MRSVRAIVLPGLVGLVLVAAMPIVASPAQAVVAPPDLGVFVGGPAKAKFGDVVIAHSDGTGQKVVHKGSLKQAPWYADLAPVTNRIVEIYGDGSKEISLSSLAVMNVDGSGYRTIAHGTRTADIYLARWNSTGTKLLVSMSSDNDNSYLAVLDLTAAHPAMVRLKGSTGLTDASFARGSDATVVASDDSGAIVTLTGGKTTLVLDPPSTGFLDLPVFAPGDATILFTDFNFAGDSVTSRIQTVSADGNVGPNTLVDTGLSLVPNWSSDGKTVFYNRFNDNTGASQPYSVPATGGTPTKIVLKTGNQYLLGGVQAPDTTAPGSATAVHVTLNGATPTPVWKLPADADVSHVVVRRLEGTTAPASPTDGTAVYNGPKTSAPDAVTAGSTYTYGVWVVDGAGNTSPEATATFVALSAPKLSSPPLVSAFSVDTTFHVGWAPTSANPVGTTYTVQWQSSNGTWQTWQDSVTTTSARFGDGGVPLAPVAGKAYALRAFTADTYGNTSAKSAVLWVEPKDDAAANARGTWKSASSATAWLGTTRTTTHSKASLSISLTGTRLWIIGNRQLLGSKAAVYVDGVKVATIDTHGAAAQRHVLWTKTVKAGKHTVRIVNLATKGRTHLAIDGFAGV